MKLPYSEVHRYILLAVVSIVVLLFWFGFGFLMPLMFPSLQYSGQWGDGFNSISSLFNGAGFIALVYTILLQLRINEDQRNQAFFKFLYDHLSNLENNIMVFELEGHKGLNGIDKFIIYCTHDPIKRENDAPLHYLHSIVTQIVSFHLMLRSNYTKMSKSEYATLCARLNGFQSHYMMKISEIGGLRSDHRNSISDLIFIDCKRAIDMVDGTYQKMS